MFKKDDTNHLNKMKPGHEERILARLNEELPLKKRTSFFNWKIAASIVVLLGVGFYFIDLKKIEPGEGKIADTDKVNQKTKTFSLGDLSPDLKKVEDYYVSTINFELSKLELTEDNQGLVDSYLEKLSELDEEYKKLNIELNQIGPNDQTINALIKNLQLRLQLLQKLKIKLNELKSSENEEDNIV